MTELYQVTAPHFCAGVVVRGGIVVETAPILAYMREWNLGRSLDYCKRKGWKMVSVS